MQGTGDGHGKTEVHHHHYDLRVDLSGIQARSGYDLEQIEKALAELSRRFANPELLWKRR